MQIEGSRVRYLITGGAGFIGSHLADALIGRGNQVLVLDDLSTGSVLNLEPAMSSGHLEFVEGSTVDRALVDQCFEVTDVCFHLASSVGVQLIVSHSLETILKSVRGTDNVFAAGAEHGRKILFTSTSEIYGKNSDGALKEDDDRHLGPPTVSRWSYSTAKAFGENLAYGYAQEHGAENIVVRLFNTVGPRQASAYGMVLPRFVRQALNGSELTVYGDGVQSRCFAHVRDTVRALVELIDEEGAIGDVFNVGCGREIPIVELARLVVDRSGSDSEINHVAFDDAYGDGFEELGRRKPDTTKLKSLTGWTPTLSVEDAIDDVILYQQGLPNSNGNGRFERDRTMSTLAANG